MSLAANFWGKGDFWVSCWLRSGILGQGSNEENIGESSCLISGERVTFGLTVGSNQENWDRAQMRKTLVSLVLNFWGRVTFGKTVGSNQKKIGTGHKSGKHW